ncbi:hypothetical protein CHS0354_026514 [Potamilus streckersoni]|uniref:Uncharacterized protein n=1 Tax=Potamilus streckersoni TaxID=2493646 RepID=A0AAE0VH78_9BIVA|nr:hypothetical protein CHS0354_026514 [Potamilus streckersoni]
MQESAVFFAISHENLDDENELSLFFPNLIIGYKHYLYNQADEEKEEKAIAAIKKEPIPVDQFLQRLRQKKLDKYLNFEVRAIVRNGEDYPSTVALNPENLSRNVNQDVIPYDHSRVILTDLPPLETNGYINASFIEGYYGYKEYIATQGPKGRNVALFWHMVWQEGVHCIVMATGLFENATQQCDKYWGDVLSVQKYVRHGDIHIYLEDVLVLAKLMIRTFKIRREGTSEFQLLKHFEMVGFNDEFTDPGFLLDCRRRIVKFMSKVSGPMLVHCRCGGGKTAVFIALDYCMKQLENEGFVDVYSAVLHLRKFHKNMVRVLAQYRLIYDTLALYVQTYVTVAPSTHLLALIQKLFIKDPESGQQGFEREFQILQTIIPKIPIGECASGHRAENRNKSRDIMLLPPERARPYLQTMESGDTDATDFINAVFIDGYHNDSKHIVTQWPMHSTINDIWRLVYDFKIQSLVLLSENRCSRSHPCFWPRELDKEERYGPIGVKYVGCQKYPHIVIRAFAVRKTFAGFPFGDFVSLDQTILKMFHYTSWDQNKGPSSTKSFIYMMGCLDDWQERTNPLSPVCIVSRDGYSKCGIYCVLKNCCDQLVSEQEVDVFNTVRIVKHNRPQLIPNVVEYTYCYHYLGQLVQLMQENVPEIMVTSPGVLEGVVDRKYEVVTGFQNIQSSNEEIADDSGNKDQMFGNKGSDRSKSNSPLVFTDETRKEIIEQSSDFDRSMVHSQRLPVTSLSVKVPSLTFSFITNGVVIGELLPLTNGQAQELSDPGTIEVEDFQISPPASPGQVWSPEKEIESHEKLWKKDCRPKLKSVDTKPKYDKNGDKDAKAGKPLIKPPLNIHESTSAKRRPLVRQNATVEHPLILENQNMTLNSKSDTEIIHV